MKNRICSFGKALLMIACLSTCGLTYSCSDDYDLDETSPDFLGKSIYDELADKGNFTTVLRLVDDLDYKDVLSKTGSKTLFVADDEAFAKFFEDNAWGVKCYEDLSLAKKKYLLYNSMLNNAYVMEMMSNVESSSSADGKNLCLRQSTAATATDTVPYFIWSELPFNQNQATDDDAGDAQYGKFWEYYRTQDKGGMYLVCDNTTPMVTHFLENNMKNSNITNDDVAFILGIPSYGTENRAYLYDARVTKRDVTCLNGYYDVLDKVLVAPSNMAEIIRTNGSTNLFSEILDRFSAPVYNATLSNNIQTLYANITDSVFVKRYFATRSQSGKFVTDPRYNKSMDTYPVLNYDPAWNQYQASTSLTAEKDMGAMFVPSDQALTDYFISGGGRVLMDRYATMPNTVENLSFNIAQIPLDIISALVNNLMKASFNETVPSKYLTIMNDARDQMFNGGDYPSLEAYKRIFDKCLIANNGVVYVMNQVISPADYAAVLAPSLYSKNTKVMRTIVRADENYIQGSDYSNAPLQQYFSTYLKAMQSSFSFFVPVDDGLTQYGYVDPASIATGNPNNYRYWTWKYSSSSTTASNKHIAILADAYRYNPATGQSGDPEADGWKQTSYRSSATDNIASATQGSGASGWGMTKQKLLIEMVNQHIVVHDNSDNDGVLGKSQKYFLSRSGAPVYIKSGNTGTGANMVVDGGWQLQLAKSDAFGGDHDCHVIEAYDQSKGTNGYGNGHTYLIDRPMQPAMQSVYNILNSNPDNFSSFLNLCMGYNTRLLSDAGFRGDNVKDEDWASTAALYRIFANGTVAKANYYGADQLVRWFNNYRYTVYIPTNAAVDDAVNKGLPTWESIETFIDTHMEEFTDTAGVKTTRLSDENQLKAQAMITMLVNFIKYHFQDQSIFVDNVAKEGEYQTASIDEQNNVYQSLKVTQSNGAMTVKDLAGNTHNVVTDGGMYNLLARDARFNSNPSTSAASCKYVESSSYAVIHQIDGVLNFTKLSDGRYDGAWKSPAKARAFVKKYQIKK